MVSMSALYPSLNTAEVYLQFLFKMLFKKNENKQSINDRCPYVVGVCMRLCGRCEQLLRQQCCPRHLMLNLSTMFSSKLTIAKISHSHRVGALV